MIGCESVEGMETRFTPRTYVEYAASLRGIRVDEIGVAPVMVASWGLGVVRALAETTGAERSPHWMYDERNPLYTGQVQGRRVSFAHLPVGAPGTVMMMEEMIACGARTFLALGWAGSLQPQIPIGSLVIPLTSRREEGTSLHYLEEDTVPSASPGLVRDLREAAAGEEIPVTTGTVWTTDAPYRETHQKIEAYRRQGVLAVDMETSAMYVLGQVRGVEVCNLLVVSDELWHEWRPAFGTPELREATARAQRVILRSLERLSAPSA